MLEVKIHPKQDHSGFVIEKTGTEVVFFFSEFLNFPFPIVMPLNIRLLRYVTCVKDLTRIRDVTSEPPVSRPIR